MIHRRRRFKVIKTKSGMLYVFYRRTLYVRALDGGCLECSLRNKALCSDVNCVPYRACYKLVIPEETNIQY